MQSKTLQRDFAVKIELLLADNETFATHAPASTTSTSAFAPRVIRKATTPCLRANRKVATLRSARNGGTVCKSEHNSPI